MKQKQYTNIESDSQCVRSTVRQHEIPEDIIFARPIRDCRTNETTVRCLDVTWCSEAVFLNAKRLLEVKLLHLGIEPKDPLQRYSLP
jgi:hypothetical protein